MEHDNNGLATWYDVAMRLVGAEKSVSVFAPLSSDWILPVERDFLTYGTDSRLVRRYIVTSPDRPEMMEEVFLRRLHYFGWQVMWINAPKSLVALIVDDKVVFVSAGSSRAFKIDDPLVVDGLVEHFDRTWQTGVENLGARIIFDDILVTAAAQSTPRIQLATQAQWDRLLASLAASPTDVHSLAPRRFEELVAELLQRDRPSGLVRLTPSSRDGGRDVLVFDESSLGKHLFLVECKRYSPAKLVDVSLVRQLYGVIEADRASAGALVTSSFFTGPAKSWPADHKVEFRLSLRDFDDLSAWIRRHAPLAI